MILIADSGSTKADWILGYNGSIVSTFHTRGFNPFFHDKKFIETELNSNEGISGVRDQVSDLYFFGAGCSSPDRIEIIAAPLRTIFKNASVTVEHDMLGTALAVCDGKPGIACILGTGSNICYFDGNKVSETHHGLGYVIGDEGSGSYFGKKLVAWYLYGILPADLQQAFRQKYQLDKESIINKVYREQHANVFLASFAPFLTEYHDHTFISEMVLEGIREYFKTNVLSYPQSKSVPVHFVGSIAWYFRDIIHQVAKEKSIDVGTILQKPVNGLAQYFLKGGRMPV